MAIRAITHHYLQPRLPRSRNAIRRSPSDRHAANSKRDGTIECVADRLKVSGQKCSEADHAAISSNRTAERGSSSSTRTLAKRFEDFAFRLRSIHGSDLNRFDQSDQPRKCLESSALWPLPFGRSLRAQAVAVPPGLICRGVDPVTARTAGLVRAPWPGSSPSPRSGKHA